MDKQQKAESVQPLIPQGIHALAKPAGSACNLKCEYCFYLEKKKLYPAAHRFQMPDKVLRRYIASYIESQPTPEVEFVWHGGEPTLVGMNFYRRVVAYQRYYRERRIIKNSIQTNGTLLTDEWCEFFKQNGFFVGLSLDGPADIHDRYRRSRDGQATHHQVMSGLRLLQKHGVEFNVLACVARETAYRPLDVYHFFKEEGIEFIQFTPIIERVPDQKAAGHGLRLAMPAVLDKKEPHTDITAWTVEPEKYGDFLNDVFDEWVRRDVGKIFVMNFEWALNAALGSGSPVCIFARRCGRAVAVEHNGDVFACDHYVYPEYRLGNLLDSSLGQLVASSVGSGFGLHKETMLPRWCRECDVLQACWGGCPKHRFTGSPDGEPGLHYLCAGYRKFFRHSAKYMIAFKHLFEFELDPKCIMQAIDQPLMIPASEKTGHRQVLLWIK